MRGGRGGSSYKEGDVEKRWDGLPQQPKSGREATWGSVVYFAQQGGYELPKRKQPAKMRRKVEPNPKPQSLDENQTQRETAADTYFEAEPTDNFHILLIKETTGGGKSHTILAKSKEHGKRTIINPPHNKLAAQAVEVAYEQGYQNPFHLLGRDHNWEDSKIEQIPEGMRTADLFAKNNCIKVDKVRAYTEKRLAPRTYCEHICEHREDCLHLAQYKGLGSRDFIASCTPGLLFDPNMRGYLESLVTATEEPTDEELAMDALLGTESKPTTEFDFAILDDYNVSSLYTDVVFTESEFKALEKAWTDTPTGEFASLVLKAFDKKKPHKILKALRKAYESTAEHHAEINESLTQACPPRRY